jgi:topoisomerase-4 subunit A
MAIKFETTTLNTMGRVASGVTGISVKEDDEVIYGMVIQDIKSEYGIDETAISQCSIEEVVLTSSKKEKKVIKLSDIKLQNRAGRGSSIMLVIMDDFIKDVKNK